MDIEELGVHFPASPPDGAPVQQSLRYLIGILDQAKKLCVRGSPRDLVFDSIQRFADRGIEFMDRSDASGSSLFNMAVAMELRDLAREEQRWVDDQIDTSSFDDSALTGLYYYKLKLARIEGATTVALGYVGTELEGDEKTGGWWARNAGQALAEIADVSSAALLIPEDTAEYRIWKARAH